MKKALLGTTALMSAALLPHAAMAQSAPKTATDLPVQLSISGYFQGGYLLNLHENANPPGGTNTGIDTGYKHQPGMVQEYGYITFSGNTKFQNGWGGGAFIQMYDFSHLSPTNQQGTKSQVKQSFARITNDNLGELRIGDVTDTRRAKAVIAPEFAPNTMFSANSPNLALVNSGIISNTTTASFGTKNPTQMVYYSPTIQGFQFGFSYAPDVSTGDTGPNPSAFVNASKPGSFYNDYSLTLLWSGNVGGVKIASNVSFQRAAQKQENPPPTKAPFNRGNPMAYNAGISATRGPFSIGISYEQLENLGGGGVLAGDNPAGISAGIGGTLNKTVDVGFTYQIGKWTTGAEFSRGMYKNVYGLGTGTPKFNELIAGGSYLLGPGVSLVGALELNDYDTGGTQYTTHGSAPVGYTGVTLLTGTNISF
ncbi:MAG TPA: porin [Stellaceae bacterium]|nr:porin [Stellaceae bacterium]